MAPNQRLRIDEGQECVESDGLRYRIEEVQGSHRLRITGYQDERQALSDLPRIHGALLRISVKRKTGLRVQADLQTVAVQDEPIEATSNPNFGNLIREAGWTHIDGWLAPDLAVVIPEHLRLEEMGAGPVSVTSTGTASRFLTDLQEGLSLPYVENVAEDERLALAIDLFSSSLWRSTPRARLINFVTTLEALLEPEAVEALEMERVDELLGHLESTRKRADESPAETSRLDRLASRVGVLKRESISRRLRRFVGTEAELLGITEEEAHARIDEAYGLRSSLLHNGHADEERVRQSAAWLSEAVPLILEGLVSEASQVADTER